MIKNNNAVPVLHAHIFKNLGYISLLSSIYAISNGKYQLALSPGCVGYTSIKYWSRNDYSYWRYIDIVTVQVGLYNNIYLAQESDNIALFLITIGLGILSFILAQIYIAKYPESFIPCILHSNVHILGNISVLILIDTV